MAWSGGKFADPTNREPLPMSGSEEEFHHHSGR